VVRAPEKYPQSKLDFLIGHVPELKTTTSLLTKFEKAQWVFRQCAAILGGVVPAPLHLAINSWFHRLGIKHYLKVGSQVWNLSLPKSSNTF